MCNSTTFALRHTQISLSSILRHFRPPSRHLLLSSFSLAAICFWTRMIQTWSSFSLVDPCSIFFCFSVKPRFFTPTHVKAVLAWTNRESLKNDNDDHDTEKLYCRFFVVVQSTHCAVNSVQSQAYSTLQNGNSWQLSSRVVRRDSSVINFDRGFFCFFFCVPQLYLWGSPLFGWDFCVCDCFSNPTIKVVTFRLRGWCVLCVFLLLAFTRLGHERQDLLSPCDEMHVCTD